MLKNLIFFGNFQFDPPSRLMCRPFAFPPNTAAVRVEDEGIPQHSGVRFFAPSVSSCKRVLKKAIFIFYKYLKMLKR